MKNKKRFFIPEAIIVTFEADDIITGSGDLDGWYDENKDDFGNGN